MENANYFWTGVFISGQVVPRRAGQHTGTPTALRRIFWVGLGSPAQTPGCFEAGNYIKGINSRKHSYDTPKRSISYYDFIPKSPLQAPKHTPRAHRSLPLPIQLMALTRQAPTFCCFCWVFREAKNPKRPEDGPFVWIWVELPLLYFFFFFVFSFSFFVMFFPPKAPRWLVYVSLSGKNTLLRNSPPSRNCFYERKQFGVKQIPPTYYSWDFRNLFFLLGNPVFPCQLRPLLYEIREHLEECAVEGPLWWMCCGRGLGYYFGGCAWKG